jgi:hypothetical protein
VGEQQPREIGPEVQRPGAARVKVAAGPEDRAQRAVAGVLVGGGVREAADRVVAEDDHELVAAGGRLQLTLDPAKLRVVEVAV